MRALLAALITAVALVVSTAQAAEPPRPQSVVEPVASAKAPPQLDLNRASAAELEAVPGIGPATATAIVELRTSRRAFAKIEELLEVKGIGAKKLATLAGYLTIVPPPAAGTQGGMAAK